MLSEFRGFPFRSLLWETEAPREDNYADWIRGQQMSFKSKRAFSTVEILRRSIEHSLLLKHNFPSEGMRCVLTLFQAVEFILKEIHGLKGAYISAGKLLGKSKKLMSRDEWEDLDWLRKKRNDIQHEGEDSWRSREEVEERLGRIYPLVGNLCERIGIDVDEEFRLVFACILQGESVPWYAKVDALSYLAIGYFNEDKEIAVNIANEAFEEAVRGLAEAWRIDEHSELTVRNLMKRMWDHEEEAAHPHYWNEAVTDDRYRYREPGWGGHLASELSGRGLDRLLGFQEISSGRKGYRSPETAVRNYLMEVWDLVQDYLSRVPFLELEQCVRESWNDIASEMETRYSDIQVPRTRDELWEPVHFFGFQMQIPYEDPGLITDEYRFPFGSATPSTLWSGEVLEEFRELLVESCGELPPGLQI